MVQKAKKKKKYDLSSIILYCYEAIMLLTKLNELLILKKSRADPNTKIYIHNLMCWLYP
jgi:hypothetical protein